MFAEQFSGLPNEEELEKVFNLLSLFSDDIIDDLVALSKNTAASRESDRLTLAFVKGQALEALYDHMCYALAPHSTSCLILELTFSALKVVRNANDSDTSVDQMMAYLMNQKHQQRRERMELI